MLSLTFLNSLWSGVECNKITTLVTADTVSVASWFFKKKNGVATLRSNQFWSVLLGLLTNKTREPCLSWGLVRSCEESRWIHYLPNGICVKLNASYIAGIWIWHVSFVFRTDKLYVMRTSIFHINDNAELTCSKYSNIDNKLKYLSGLYLRFMPTNEAKLL